MNVSSNKNEVKILFLGLDGSGKSTIITKLRDFQVQLYIIYQNEEMVEIYPTPFMKTDKIVFENKSITLIEVSGQVVYKYIQQRYRKYWQMFYPDVNGIMFVVDGTDDKRLQIVKDLIEQLDKTLENKTPIVFLVNKQDVEGAFNKSQAKEYIDLDRLDSNFIWTIK